MKIQFEPFDKEAELLFEMPKPAVQVLPKWYKDMPTYMDGENQAGLSSTSVAVSNLTAKGCSPLLDALSAGYMFELPCDLEFRKNERGELGIRWATNINLISGHGPDQAPGLPTPVGGSDTLLKWRPGWRIITPPGWSTLFVHPLNRHDLPFRLLSGVVDTDTYPLGVEFPFQLLHTIDTNIFIMEKGTPICQAIPIKREDWESGEFIPFDEDANRKAGFDLKSTIVRSYKKKFWHKKRYQ
jgi:hypothetical protein